MPLRHPLDRMERLEFALLRLDSEHLEPYRDASRRLVSPMSSMPPIRKKHSKRPTSSRSGMWFRGVVLLLACLISGAAFAHTAAGQSILEPASRSAKRVADLWWLMFWLGTVIFVLVMLLVLFAVARGRNSGSDSDLGIKRRQSVVITGGVVMPLIVLAVVFGYTLHTLTGLAEDHESSDWTVEVVGHQFWWEVRYPDEGVITANEIHIPVGQPVEFKLTSADVIHSFWVPELGGKLDMMPGTTTSVTFTADEPGRYRGQCAQMCGVQHANMALYIVADESDEFGAWLENQRQVAELPTEGSVIERGREVFLSSACVYCHAVRGQNNPAASEFGPDLTHLASRDTIAAGTLENNIGNLAGWIIDPQHIKPGNKMPGVSLGSEELQALLAYLNSLD